MKKKLLNAVRMLVSAGLLFGAVYGYVCYEATLVPWWLPVAVAVGIAAATLPFAMKWQWLTGMADPTCNRICHLLATAAMAYLAFLGGNTWTADPASEYEEEVTVARKKIEEGQYRQRIGRHHRSVPGKRYTNYYLYLVFDNGLQKKTGVSSAVYNRCREGGRKVIVLQRGGWGFPVIKQYGARVKKK